MDNATQSVVGIIGAFWLIFILFLVIKYAVRAGTGNGHQEPRVGDRVGPPPQEFLDRVTQITGPGFYEIKGVDKTSKMDTTWRVNAESEAHARIRAELEGIIIVSCKYQGMK